MGMRVGLGMLGPGMVQSIEDGMGRFESPEIGMKSPQREERYRDGGAGDYLVEWY